MQHTPWLVIVLREFKLVLSNDVGILIKDDESHGAVDLQVNNLKLASDYLNHYTHVVPASSAPMNSPCFRVMVWV